MIETCPQTGERHKWEYWKPRECIPHCAPMTPVARWCSDCRVTQLRVTTQDMRIHFQPALPPDTIAVVGSFCSKEWVEVVQEALFEHYGPERCTIFPGGVDVRTTISPQT